LLSCVTPEPAPVPLVLADHAELTCCCAAAAAAAAAVSHVQLRDYKPGSCRADLEEARAAARAQQGLEPDSDEVRSMRLACL
jgi:hypothetical protein